MNNTFDIKRFGLLLKKDFFENWRKYMLQALTLFSIILVCFIFQSLNKYSHSNGDYLISYGYDMINGQLVIICFIIFTGAYAVFLSQMMDSIRNKQKRIHYLTFPCSSLEKYLSKLIIHVVGFILVFLASVYLADLIRIIIYSLPESNFEVRSIRLLGELFDEKDNKPMALLSAIYLFILSLYALGSTFWQKSGFVKTTVALGAIAVTGVLIIFGVAATLFTPESQIDLPKLSQGTQDILYYIATAITFVCTVFIYVLAYYRFKEAELIERW